MSEFTKGPWVQNESYDIEIWGNGELVCNIPTWDPDNTGFNVCNEVAANANLIAAAPDMLEALEEIAATLDAEGNGCFNKTVSEINKIIAKAKGEGK